MDGISAGFIVQKLADQGKVPFLQLQLHLNIFLFGGGVCHIAPGGGGWGAVIKPSWVKKNI